MKNSRISLILISLLVVNNLYGDPVVYLNKDQKAPYPGFLFDPDKAKDLRQHLLEQSADRQLIDSLNKSLSLQSQISDLNQKKVNICVTQIDSLSKAAGESKTLGDTQKLLWFGLGVLATGLAVYGASKLK